MNSILARLLEMDIVGMPVHDSVIVPAQHKNVLETLMVEEYQKHKRLNGFKPVVDIK
ncbi:MAG: hypothetical protein NDI81_07420 [Desulfobacula sp.]|nr:hypothetical protein [Desulfobacula sp.]